MSDQNQTSAAPAPSASPSPAAGSSGLKQAVLHIRVVDEKGVERVPKGNDAVRARPAKLPYSAKDGFSLALEGTGDLLISVEYDGFEVVEQHFRYEAPARAPTLVPFWPGSNQEPSATGRRPGYLLSCMKLTRTAGGHDDQRSPKVFNLTVTLHPTRTYIAVIGADYWEAPASAHPKRKALDFDQYAITFAKHLLSTGVLNLSSTAILFDCQRGRVEAWDLAQGVGWRRHDVIEKRTPCPAWPQPKDYMDWVLHFQSSPGDAKKYIGATDVYKYLSTIGERLPGTVANFSVFSHAWHGGPILYNTSTWKDKSRKERFEGDLDMRYLQDFEPPNVKEWTNMPRAFARDATIHIWGCFDVNAYDAMVRYLLTNSKSRFRDHGYDLDRAGVVTTLSAAINDASFMRRIAKFAGVPAFGGLPGFGADNIKYDEVPTLSQASRRAVDGQIVYVPVTTRRRDFRGLFESAELGSQRFNEFGYMLYKP